MPRVLMGASGALIPQPRRTIYGLGTGTTQRRRGTGEPAPQNYEEAHDRAVNLYAQSIWNRSKTSAPIRRRKTSAPRAGIRRISQGEADQVQERTLLHDPLRRQRSAKKATREDSVSVNYEGKLIDGKTFDKSRRPVESPVAGVVAGFSEGVQLVGEGRQGPSL